MMGEGSGNPTGREPVDRLAEEFLGRYRRGEWPQISEYLERHPELADEIRAVFPPLIMMERAALAGPPSSGEPDRIGPYRTIRLLGAGGQGQVFLAEDTRLKRRVALKVLSAAADPAGQMLARFRREAAVTAKLDHPGICTVYEAGEDRGVAFIAMRYVEGETLAQAIAKGQKGDDTTSATREGISRLVAIVEKAARALHIAHEAGLVHRDIKPGNLMITPAGDPVILDFGLARDVSDEEQALTRTGMRMGTPVYMSPEQIAAERTRVDHRTDIYSLGVTLYECLTLRRPFEAATWDQLYHQILSSEPEAPRRRNPMVPRDLQVVLSTAMEKDRDRRYQTALDLAEDLRRVRELEPIRARPAGPALRLKRWAQRNPVVAASVGAVFLALAVGLGVSAKLLGETRRERDAKAEALVRAGGLSLAAHAAAVVEKDPGLALSLAVEAARRAPGPQANGALLRALELNREKKRFRLPWGGPFSLSVAFSPDGARLAVGGGRATILDLGTGGRTDVSSGTSTGVAYSPDGARLLVTMLASEKTAAGLVFRAGELIDASTGTRVRAFELPPGEAGGTPRRALFSPDGTRVATFGGQVDLWEVASGRRIGRIEDAQDLVFSPDGGSALASGASFAVLWSDGGTRPVFTGPGRPVALFWDARGPRVGVAEGDQLRIVDAISGNTVGGLRAPFAKLWWSPDGTRLFTTTTDQKGHLWDVARAEELGTYDIPELFGRRMELGRDGRLLWGPEAVFSASGSLLVFFGQSAVLVDALRGTVRGSLVGHQGLITDASFRPGGDAVATVSRDGTVRVWDATAARPVIALRGGEEVTSVAFSPDGTRVITADNYGAVRLWDARTGTRVAETDPNAYAARFTRDGRLAFALCLEGQEDHGPDRRIHFLDAATGAEIPAPVDAIGQLQKEVLWTGDGRFIAGIREDEDVVHVVVADLESGTCAAKLDLDVEEDHVWVEGLSEDGRLLLTYANSGNLVVRELPGGAPVATLPMNVPDVVRMTPDGRTVVAADGEDLIVWRIRDGAEVARLRGHTNAIVSLSLSPDGRLAATASFDGTARVWDIANRKALFEVEPRAGQLNLAKISPDSRHLLTVCPDGDAHLWDLATGDLVAHLAKPEGRRMFSGWYEPVDAMGDFSPDGTRVVTPTRDGVVRIWPVDPLVAALASAPRELTPEERGEYLDPLDETFALRRAARRRVDARFHELLLKEDVLETLRRERDLPQDVRTLALEMARERETDRTEAQFAVWEIVHASNRSESDRQFALRVARGLLREARGPEVADTKVLVAAALCRTGDDDAALRTLAEAEEEDGATGAFLAVRALAHARLGHVAEAKADLARAAAAEDLDSDGQALLEEARALLPK